MSHLLIRDGGRWQRRQSCSPRGGDNFRKYREQCAETYDLTIANGRVMDRNRAGRDSKHRYSRGKSRRFRAVLLKEPID